MTNKLTVVSVVEKNKIASDNPFLVLLEVEITNLMNQVVEVLRLVNNPEAITYQGHTYQAMPFEIELKSDSGSQAELSLSITDYSRKIEEQLNLYGGGVGFKATIMVVSNLLGPADIKEFFEVTGASAGNYIISISLGAENSLTKSFPKRSQRRGFCGWIYRDPNTCKYAGDKAVCDHTLHGTEGCKAHGNQKNFGGFPGIVGDDRMYQ